MAARDGEDIIVVVLVVLVVVVVALRSVTTTTTAGARCSRSSGALGVALAAARCCLPLGQAIRRDVLRVVVMRATTHRSKTD